MARCCPKRSHTTYRFYRPVRYNISILPSSQVSLTVSLLSCWLLTLTWLAVVLNAQIQHIDSTVQSG
ncbi:hypothetical protein J6590_022827 [Homalodisca vitripennis]|nr:hypothetical protein J6590_022827 [Homalodisca vitripennis]